MIGSIAVTELVPLEYRYALDATMAILGDRRDQLTFLCHAPELLPAVEERLLVKPLQKAQAGLWVEPMMENWQSSLQQISSTLANGAVLVIIASQPLSRTLPERKHWTGRPLGYKPSGLRQLGRVLKVNDFELEKSYGIHTLFSIALNKMGQQFTSHGQLALGAKLHFASRLHYCTTGLLTPFATVRLIVSRKKELS